MIDYPIDVSEDLGNAVFMRLDLTGSLVIKSAPFRTTIARQLMLEAFNADRLDLFDVDGAAHLKIRMDNGSVTYRVVGQRGDLFDLVRVEHMDSTGLIHIAPSSTQFDSITWAGVL